MKWILFLILLPTLAWADCSELSEALKECKAYTCSITLEDKVVASYDIKGYQNGLCIVETIDPMTDGQDCRLTREALPLFSNLQTLTIESINAMKNIDINTINMEEFKKTQEKRQQDILNATAEFAQISNARSLCRMKNPTKAAKFQESMVSLAKAAKPLASMIQYADQKNFKRLFSDSKAKCLLSDELISLNQAKILKGVSIKEDCEKLKTEKCSALFAKASKGKAQCPAPLSILYVDPAEAKANNDNMEIPALVIETLTCERNGIIRYPENKLTFDPAFRKNSSRYCANNSQPFHCEVQIIDQPSGNHLKKKNATLSKRDGAETMCMKEARKLASEYCKKQMSIYAEVRVSTKKNATRPEDILLNKAYTKFCETYRWHKFFN